MSNLLKAQILSVLKSPTVLSEFPEVTGDLLQEIENVLTVSTSNNYTSVTQISSVSPGLTGGINQVYLNPDWGVRLNGFEHNYIDIPGALRSNGEKFFVTNTRNNGVIGCTVLDKYLNLEGIVGKPADYGQASDFIYNNRTQKYLIASKTQDSIKVYNSASKKLETTIGGGILSSSNASLSAPVAIGLGIRMYVVCQTGQCSGLSPAPVDDGFLKVMSSDGVSGFEVPLYPGKNGGTGRCFEGEIVSPKDIFVKNENNRDILYILNGTNEIGVFDTQDWSLIKVYTIPNNLTGTQNFNRITVDSKYLYVTSASGKVIMIDLVTRGLYGVYGEMKDESNSAEEMTLGYFNGLEGITVSGDTIYTSETVNNRIQSFGKSLVSSDTFSVTFETTPLYGRRLKDIVPSIIGGQSFSSVKVISDRVEYDLMTAVYRNLQQFQIRVYIKSSQFSKKNPIFTLFPIYLLTEGN